MAIVESRISVWEALAGRAPGQPVGPADPGVWSAVAERVNPAKARPVLRPGIEQVELTSARGVPYVMLRSPDRDRACYLRLTPEEAELTRLMDGSRSVARLVADFTRISGQLAPDQVRRVVADLAGNRMLEELPVDAFAPLQKVRRDPWPLRFGRALLAFAQGRRMVIANVDPLITVLYRAGGRLLFTRAAAAVLASVAAIGLGLFVWQWFTGAQSVFLAGDSYVAGAAVLLGLNILALACHELGHALATKHAGRRVPAAGFLVYFGIPSVFVDTTDVWMSGRRGRILTTLAGPAAGLILAGASAIVGFVVPEAAPWCFKLSFAWYVNALFNLNPFLALDGYYLLMDWLEVPNLRARGLAWVGTRLRRRPPRWSELDREGRLVALYGLLAVGWVIIALNIAYRIYVDRVGGLITGLWRSGWPARLLLVTVVLALLSPLVYLLFGWLARQWRRAVASLREREIERDLPRRIDALRTSGLRSLPPDTLAALAAQSRWVRPRTGEQLVFAGAAQPEVFAVVDGALEARAPGDPGGTVRQRVGAGGLVGVGPAFSGAPSPLDWYAAGTTLLAMPASSVASALGPAASGMADAYGTKAEAEALFMETPAMAGLSYEDRLGLASVAVPVSLAPGASLTLASPDQALLVASGVIVTPDGQELARGTLIGPAGEAYTPPVATARTPVRLFSLPAVSGMQVLLGTPVGMLAAEAEGRAASGPPVAGVHPQRDYAPLAVPPGAPPPNVDTSLDGWFEKRLRWLLILVLLLALFLTGGNVLLPGIAWAEMPSDKALLRVADGTVTAVVGGVSYDLSDGDDIYVGEGDQIEVGERSQAALIYRGGAESTLCAGVDLSVGPLQSAGRPIAPVATLMLRRGFTIHKTATASSAFTDLELTVVGGAGTAQNDGAAAFGVSPRRVLVAAGAVSLSGSPVPPAQVSLSCGEGDVVALPAPSPTPSPPPEPSLTPTPTPEPSLTPSPTPTEVVGGGGFPGGGGPGGGGSTSTTRPPTTTTTATTTTTSTAPPDRTPPTVKGVQADERLISTLDEAGSPCYEGSSASTTVRILVDDPTDDESRLTVRVRFSTSLEGPPKLIRDLLASHVRGPEFEVRFGDLKGGELLTFQNSIDVDVLATDPAGNQGTFSAQGVLIVIDCARG